MDSPFCSLWTKIRHREHTILIAANIQFIAVWLHFRLQQQQEQLLYRMTESCVESRPHLTREEALFLSSANESYVH